ncbi:RDD family protein [Stenoxybacter acetivorans]|uniref:RDD family protein n=1 Tax=Stenoxybacter acetivorans TaxID=422441 RepID=UPI00056323D5|nr:RDD family protein [Stenoxybacter acetivorans]
MALSIGTQESEQELEVELASPVARIGACALNMVINFIMVSISSFMMLGFMYMPPLVPLGCVLAITYFIWQIKWMSQYGQSIGKCIFGIKVIKLNGENPGFIRNILLRECVSYLIIFGFIFCIAMLNADSADASLNIIRGLYSVPWLFSIAILFFLVDIYPTTANLPVMYGLYDIPRLIWLICLIMLFRTQTQRRTLQDYLAGTLVVKVKKGQ